MPPIALRLAQALALLVLVLAALVGLPYFFASIYDFPPAEPFSGDVLYNPYENLETGWWKGNFQVASYSWGGLTDGTDTPEQAFEHYRSYGYDILSITDYQKINRAGESDPSHIPSYEHGYNVGKRHHLGIGAREVTWFDLPLLQTAHHKQSVLDAMAPHVEYLVLAHPAFMDAFVPSDMEQLTGYHAVEVLNRFEWSVALWDAALSAGRPVWGMGNDDTHNIYNMNRAMRCWTMVNAREPRAGLVLEALRRGRFYAVEGRRGFNDNPLVSLALKDDVVTVRMQRMAEVIRFVGQGGRTLLEVRDTDRATYVFGPFDTYVRVYVGNQDTKLFLNPILRTKSGEPVLPAARVNGAATWMARISLLLVYAMACGVVLRVLDRRRWAALLPPLSPPGGDSGTA